MIDQDIKKEESESKDYKKKAKFIFYNMYSPIEMSRLFERAGINYNSSLLNPVENADDYATNVEKALNLGVYGVDLSYIRLFDQPQKSIEYLNTIQNLAGRLGIPKNVVDLATSEVDHYIEDRDSLYRIAFEAFSKADDYLKKNDRNNIAALIILGGWVETMHIALEGMNLDDPNEEMLSRIASQKYSLTSLVLMLGSYTDDLEIAKYLVYLRKLKRAFDKFEIYYEQGSVDIDTVNKKIEETSGMKVEISSSQLKEVYEIIIKIRKEIVS